MSGRLLGGRAAFLGLLSGAALLGFVGLGCRLGWLLLLRAESR